MRLANLPQRTPPAKASRPFRFVVPAFKVSPKHLLRLARFATVAQPDYPPQSKAPRNGLYPVTLPAVEAFQFTPILLGDVSYEDCRAIAQALTQVIGERPVLLVASTDLSHYYSYEEAGAWTGRSWNWWSVSIPNPSTRRYKNGSAKPAAPVRW